MKRIVPFLITFAIAAGAFANGLGGQRLEKVVGDKIIDIGTDITDPITDSQLPPAAGVPIQFDFNLLKGDTRDVIENTSVTVNIEHNGKPLMNSNIIMQPPLTLLVYTFPEGGDYILKVTFYDKDNTLATASFPLKFPGSTGREFYLEGFLVCLFLGIVGGYWVGRKRKAAA